MQPSIDLPDGRSLLFPQVSVSISIPAVTSRCFVYEFDSELLKEVEKLYQAVFVDDFGWNRVRFTR